MTRFEDLLMASIERLGTNGWVIGPPIEPEAWRRRLRSAARTQGWRLATGIGPGGYPWAARTDLIEDTGTPWNRLGVTPRSFFETYSPPD